jgi:hypothetical protein
MKRDSGVTEEILISAKSNYRNLQDISNQLNEHFETLVPKSVAFGPFETIPLISS